MPARDKTPAYLYLILAAGLCYLGVLFNRGIGVVDEGWVLHFAQEIAEGRVPYRDFAFHPVPGSLFIQAGILRLFGQKVIAVRLYGLLQGLGFMLMAYGIARSYSGPRNAAAAALLYVPWNIFAFHRMAHYNVDSLFFAMLSFYLLLLYTGRAKLHWLCLAGLASGLSAICKQNMGAASAILLIIIASCTPSALPGSGKIPRRPARAAISMLFFGLPILLLILYFHHVHALSDLYECTVHQSLKSKQGWVIGNLLNIGLPGLTLFIIYLWVMALVIRPLIAGRRNTPALVMTASGLILFHAGLFYTIHRLHVYLMTFYVLLGVIPMMIIMLAIGLFAFDNNRIKLGPVATQSLRLTIMFCALFWLTGLSSGSDFAHTISGACLSMICMPYILIHTHERYRSDGPKKSRMIRAAAIIVIMAFGFVIPLTRDGVLISQEPWWKASQSVIPPELYGIRVSPEMKAEVNGIYNVTKNELKPEELFLVFPLGSYYYFLAHKPAPAPQEFLFFEVFHDEEKRQLADAFHDNKISMVLMASGGHPLGILAEGGYTSTITTYIKSHFVAGEQIGRYKVYRLKKPPRLHD